MKVTTVQPPDEIFPPVDSYEPDADFEAFDDAPEAAESPATRHATNAWRELELRAESKWLREQLTDWDDGEFFDAI